MTAPIIAFEHDRIRVGDERGLTDRHFRALARFNERNDSKFFQLGHNSIRFTQYVGLIQIGALRIEILPKTDRREQDLWRSALIEMVRATSESRVELFESAHVAVVHRDLFETYVERFLTALERLLREGLTKRYRDVEDNLSVFRGRLLVGVNATRNAARADRFYVEHQIYDLENLPNQVLARALSILSRSILSPELTTRVVQARGAFPEIAERSIGRPELDRLTCLGRSFSRYREALEFARFIILSFNPTFEFGDEPLIAALLDMNVLFEEFVASMFRRVVRRCGHRVETQVRRVFWEPRGHRARRMKPDVVVYLDDRRLVIDSKWKLPRDGMPDDADLRQMFVYNECYDASHGILLYPATEGSFPVAGPFKVEDAHHCSTHFLELFASGRFSITHIERQLRELISQ